MAYTQPTLLDIKKGVSSQLGKTDYLITNLVRDLAINRARSEFYAYTDWSFRRKTTKLVFTLSAVNDYTNGLGIVTLPVLCSPYDDPLTIWEYPVLGQIPIKYVESNISEIGQYTLNDATTKVYAVDNELSQIVANQTTSTPFITYLQMPADRALDGSEDSLPEPCSLSGLNAIILLAIAEYWLAAERDEDEYERFYKRYTRARDIASIRDERLGAPVTIPRAYTGKNLGFNRSRF